MPTTHGRRARACAALLLAAGLSMATAAPAVADAAPPALPVAASGCVGPSPVVYGDRVPWPTARMVPYQAWPLSRGKGVLVAVLDSGVSGDATGLAGAVTAGQDVVAGGPARSDCLGRGTALASIVAGRPTAGSGIVGMAPEATVLPIRVIGSRRDVTPEAIAAGIDAAVDAGAGVILLGTGHVTGTAQLQAAVARAAGQNVLVVAPVNDQAAGVAGQAPPAWYPAAYPQVLAVGGVDADGRATEVTGAASGLDVLAAAVDAVVPGPSGPGHYSVGGSAIAAAYVAGAAALVRGYRPDLTADQVRERLVVTAERPPHAVAGTVDPYAAVTTVEPGEALRKVRAAAVPVVVEAAPAADQAVARARLVCVTIAVVTFLVAATLWIRRSLRRRTT
ncbi:S8 family serine peptidase [Dactylosporangium sucinum]|uniref:Peptidase S8 n=1 Tax=Dactylosporangium sucinum TaxID=1424081 RepID=A0A917X4J1_9ACTN|nr:S8 family serine peptidase [Dactylosporangium sucinum]GGM63353.1 peptidase S8 [Dactylosporangium sucinum]